MSPFRTPALATALALLLAGCGGSDEPTPDRGTGPVTAPQVEAPAGDDRGPSNEREPDGGSNGAAADDSRDKPRRRLTAQERRTDKERIHALVRELVDSMNARDESVCTRLFTQRLIEPEKREAAAAACRRGVAEQRGRLRLVEIEIVRIRETERGREAGVQFLLSAPERRTTRYAYHLVHEDGEYVIDRGIPVEQPSR